MKTAPTWSLSRNRPYVEGCSRASLAQSGSNPSRLTGCDPAAACSARCCSSVLCHRRRRFGQAAVPVVRSVHPQRAELRGQCLDLPAEVVGGESALAELLRQRVRGGGQVHPCVGELGEQPRHQGGVARIVELELVHREQPVSGQSLDGRSKAEHAHQLGDLAERAVRLGAWHGVPQRRQQVGLADAEAAVQVHAGGRRPRWPICGTTSPSAAVRRPRRRTREGSARRPPATVQPDRAGRSRIAPRRTAAAAPGRRSARPRR